MKYQNTQQARGFTIIEVLVYMGVLILIASALVVTFFSLDDVLIRNSTDRALTNAAAVTFERMLRDIRGADSVHTGFSTLNTSPGVLTLTAGATTTAFTLDGDAVTVSINGDTLGPLTSSGVTADELIFRRYDNGTTELVRIELTLSASSKASSVTKTFYTSAILRGSYE